MADKNGQQLHEGDRVEIVQMDDPAYRWLIGEKATVAHIPDDETDASMRDRQVSILLDTPQAGIPGLSTHQAWVAKIADSVESAPSNGAVEG